MRADNLLFLIVLSSILYLVNGVPNGLRATTALDDASAASEVTEELIVGSTTGVVKDGDSKKEQEELHRFLEDLEDEHVGEEEQDKSSGSNDDFQKPPIDQGLINFGIFLGVVMGLYCIFQIAFCIWGGKSHSPSSTLRIAHP